MKPTPSRCLCQVGRTDPRTGSAIAVRKTRASAAAYRHQGCGPPPAWCCHTKSISARRRKMRMPERGRRRRPGRLRRIGDDEASVRVRQIECEKVNLAFDALDDADGLAKVHLGMARRMHQRHEHLLRSLPPTGHVVLHDRDAAREAVLVAKPFENPLRRMLLLLRPAFVVRQDIVDGRNVRAQLRLRRRPRPPITRRNRKRHHLGDRPRINPKPPRRRPLAQSLNLNRISNLRIELHLLHPSPFAVAGTGLPTAGFLLRRNRPARLLH